MFAKLCILKSFELLHCYSYDTHKDDLSVHFHVYFKKLITVAVDTVNDYKFYIFLFLFFSHEII